MVTKREAPATPDVKCHMTTADIVGKQLKEGGRMTPGEEEEDDGFNFSSG